MAVRAKDRRQAVIEHLADDIVAERDEAERLQESRAKAAASEQARVDEAVKRFQDEYADAVNLYARMGEHVKALVDGIQSAQHMQKRLYATAHQAGARHPFGPWDDTLAQFISSAFVPLHGERSRRFGPNFPVTFSSHPRVPAGADWERAYETIMADLVAAVSKRKETR
jgi:hypothetical protein